METTCDCENSFCLRAFGFDNNFSWSVAMDDSVGLVINVTDDGWTSGNLNVENLRVVRDVDVLTDRKVVERMSHTTRSRRQLFFFSSVPTNFTPGRRL